jgi:hypothetical protein
VPDRRVLRSSALTGTHAQGISPPVYPELYWPQHLGMSNVWWAAGSLPTFTSAHARRGSLRVSTQPGLRTGGLLDCRVVVGHAPKLFQRCATLADQFDIFWNKCVASSSARAALAAPIAR